MVLRAVSRASQAAALLAIGALAAAAGLGGAAWLDGRGAPPPPPAALPAAPPEEPSSSRLPRPRPSRRLRRPRRRLSRPSPRAPGPGPPPEPDPGPVPELPPPSEPRTAPQPLPTPPQVDEPADLHRDRDPGRRGLDGPRPPAPRAVAALAAAVPGSAEDADIRRQLGLWSAYLAPDAAAAPAWQAWYDRPGRAGERLVVRGPRLSVRPRAARDEDGVILTYRRGQGFAVNPVATTGRWGEAERRRPRRRACGRAHGDGGRAGCGRPAVRRLGVLRRRRRPRGHPARDLGDGPGRVALLMAARTTRPATALRAGGPGCAGGLRRAGRPRRRAEHGRDDRPRSRRPGTSSVPIRESPWKGAALNGFMVTILNLRGAAAVLDRGRAESRAAIALAQDLADRGAVTLERHLATTTRGSWSYYDCSRPGPLAQLPRRPELPLLPRAAAGGARRAYPEFLRHRRAGRHVDRAGAACPSAETRDASLAL